MENQITIREAITETDVTAFWEQLHTYHKRDIFPNPENEDLEYFLGSEYHDHMMNIHSRPQDRCYFLFFHRDGQDIGFAIPVIYDTEDGKCFIMEFCVFPEFRGHGTGKTCARLLLNWAKERGALYAELNYGGDPRRERFWQRVGFQKNGADEWGEPLMVFPPKEAVPITVEVLTDPEDWQIKKLENGFRKEIGECPATEEQQETLSHAIRDGSITFLLAKRGCRAVGMCSVVKQFSTFEYSNVGVLEDFYIEPVFRKKGIARKLTQVAQQWGKENGLASLCVTCAPCDQEMYRALGFERKLGTALAKIY